MSCDRSPIGRRSLSTPANAHLSTGLRHNPRHRSRFAPRKHGPFGMGACSTTVARGAAWRKPLTNGDRRSKSVSFVMSVMPCSRHDAAISASLSSDGFSSRDCHPSRAARVATTRPLSANAATEGANTRRRRSNGWSIPRWTSRLARSVLAPAASSCITTALR